MTQIDREADWIFAGDEGNPFVETMALRECVSNFIAETNIQTVGGLYPCIRLDSKGAQLIGDTVEIPLGGERIELNVDQTGRWIQRHLNSSTEVPLMLPWEIDFASYKESQTFDYLKEAKERFHGPKDRPPS